MLRLNGKVRLNWKVKFKKRIKLHFINIGHGGGITCHKLQLIIIESVIVSKRFFEDCKHNAADPNLLIGSGSDFLKVFLCGNLMQPFLSFRFLLCLVRSGIKVSDPTRSGSATCTMVCREIHYIAIKLNGTETNYVKPWLGSIPCGAQKA